MGLARANTWDIKTSRETELCDLMVAYQGGQLDAFEKLHAQLSPSLRDYLTSVSRDPQLTEGVLRETFLQMHRSRHTYMPSRPVRDWAFAIARYVYGMHEVASVPRAKYQGEVDLREGVNPK